MLCCLLGDTDPFKSSPHVFERALEMSEAIHGFEVLRWQELKTENCMLHRTSNNLVFFVVGGEGGKLQNHLEDF